MGRFFHTMASQSVVKEKPMPNKQLIPLPSVSIYNDDGNVPTPPLLTPEDFQLTDLLRQLGKPDAAELARPLRLLNGFKPMQMLSKLQEFASLCGGPAAIVCVRKPDMLPDFIWSYDAGNGVNRLVNCRANGGWVLGIMTFPFNGGFCSYPERCEEQELYLSLMHAFGKGYDPQLIAAEQLLTIASKPADLETTLDLFTDWEDKSGLKDIHSEITVPASICTENGQTGVSNNAR